jgi:hypothetical protein
VVKCLIHLLQILQISSKVIKDGRVCESFSFPKMAFPTQFLKILIGRDSKIQEALDKLAQLENHAVKLTVLSTVTNLFGQTKISLDVCSQVFFFFLFSFSGIGILISLSR